MRQEFVSKFGIGLRSNVPASILGTFFKTRRGTSNPEAGNGGKICLSNTFPDWEPEKILSTFIDKIIWHDWRGFSPEQKPYEGYVEGYYVSCKYVWTFAVFIDANNEPKTIKVAKYDFPEGFLIGNEKVTLRRIGYWEVPPKSKLAKYITQHLPKPT
ncbi:MAG: hypothetical protein QXW42_04330 [Thermofilum sp.]